MIYSFLWCVCVCSPCPIWHQYHTTSIWEFSLFPALWSSFKEHWNFLLSSSLVGISCETSWTFLSTQCSDLKDCGQIFNAIVYFFYEENTSLNFLFPPGAVLANYILSENDPFNLLFKCISIELNRNSLLLFQWLFTPHCISYFLLSF